MKKLTKTYHTARKLVLALAILAGAGAALWKLSENRRLKKQYMDTWQADGAPRFGAKFGLHASASGHNNTEGQTIFPAPGEASRGSGAGEPQEPAAEPARRGPAKVRKAVADAAEPAVQAATTATIPETEAERCAECDWEQDTGAV